MVTKAQGTIIREYLKTLNAYPVGLVVVAADKGQTITCFGNIRECVRYGEDKHFEINDGWGKAHLLVDNKQFDFYALNWKTGYPIVFEAEYTTDLYGIPQLVFKKELSLTTVIKEIFEANFQLYQHYWEAKHHGKPKSVAEYKLHRAHISLLMYILRRGQAHYKEIPDNITTGNKGAQLTQLKYFGLVIPLGKGMWKLTDFGINFLRGKVKCNDKIQVVNYGEGWKKSMENKEIRQIGTDRYAKELEEFNEEEIKQMNEEAKQLKTEIFGEGVTEEFLWD